MPTAAMPISRKSAEKTPTPPPAAESTSVLPKELAFDILDRGPSHTATGKQAPPRKLLDFSKNKNIDRFELIREIARGGMGQVFLARDTKLGRKVAIKFLLHDDPDFVQRFLVEARATARCTHENIVTIYEVGEFQGLPYMVLEYLEGKTLSDVLESQPSAKQFAELMVPVVRALERAHEHGIVHRDLKPSNIFVTDRGQVKVLDFGVARMIDRAGVLTEQVAARIETKEVHFDAGSGSNVTFTGSGDSLVGTMPYMSPEQWGADVVDHQSDLWAVGIMFWRALTNVHPAATMAPDRLRARLLDLAIPLRSIADVDATIAPELIKLVDRCTKKKKSERYANASELLADLQAFLSPAARGEDTCPYRGLAAFGEADAKYFFGRTNEIRTALSQLETWPLLAVIGPSGVGKSSFVHAGLVPAMRAAGNLRVHVLRPGRVPLHRLASILEDSAATGQPSNDATDLVGQLRDAPGLFGAMLRKVAARHAHRVLVVVDQLEELFTLCDSDEVRKQFLAAILAAADDPTSPVRVVLSMRADFLDRLAGHKQFLAELSRGIFFLTAPDQENLRETIVRPAELAGYSFQDQSIVEDMLQAATSRGALPLLSFAASRLWDSRDRAKKQLTVGAYKQMGGVGGAFARHADQVASAVPPQSQMLLRAIMTRLVTPEGTRAVIDHAELLTLGAREEVELVLDQLVRARLINSNVEGDHGATVEIVHEMLISEWPTLRRWLEDSQALRGFLHELRQAAKQWAARGKPADLVWRGATAQEALGNARRHVLDLSAIEQEFLEAVRKLVVRTRWIKIGVVSTIVGALVLVMLGGAIAIVRIQAAERDAQQKAIDAEAAASLAQDAERTAVQERATADQQRREAERERDAVKAAEAARSAAETQVKEKQGEVNQSREELEKALERTKQEKARAAEAAAIAQQATAETKAAKAQVEEALDKERERVKQLELEKKHIYDKDLH